MFNRTLKIAALAAATVVLTAGSSFAATWAWVDHDSKVRSGHSTSYSTVNYVDEGDKVKVIGQWGSWYKIQIPGPDGWVKANVLSWGGGYGAYHDDYHPHVGGSVCVGGSHASFCLGSGY